MHNDRSRKAVSNPAVSTRRSLGVLLRSAAVAATGLVAVALFAPSCGEASCSTLCSEAQAGNCTTIKGDCGNFCTAIDAIKLDSGCGTQQDAYITCLNQGPVCDQSCGDAQNSFAGCVGTYCLKHGNDANCKTIEAAFQ